MTKAQPPGDDPLGASVLGRRSFLARVSELVAALVTLLLAIRFVRFILYPVPAKASPGNWLDLGPVSGFASLTAPSLRIIHVTADDGWLESVSSRAVYITKDRNGRTEVLTAVCPHLGCTVQWNAERNQFDCPCHGSEFAPDGSHLAGPAARAMDSLPVRIEKGNLKVRYDEYRQLLAFKEIAT